MSRSKAEVSSEDPNEPIIALKRGVHATPWHPRTMGSPHIYKVCVIGAKGTGKSSICNRLVSRTFEAQYRPTRSSAQLFWRRFDETVGMDIMIEIEDTPGLDLSNGSLMTSEQHRNVETLLRPLVWFEKRRKEKEQKKEDHALETDPLLPDGTPKVSQAAGKKSRARAGNTPAVGAGRCSGTGGGGGGGSGGMSNPIGNFEAQFRKRMGFVIVADISSNASFEAAYTLVERIFDRLQASTAHHRCRQRTVASLPHAPAAVSLRPPRDHPLPPPHPRSTHNHPPSDRSTTITQRRAHALAPSAACPSPPQFDVSDSIICPVSIVIVGNKSDLRGDKREMPPEKELRDQVRSPPRGAKALHHAWRAHRPRA